MAKAVFVVLTNPTDETREDEYNDWYSNTHLADLIKLDGITSARRFKMSETQGRNFKPLGPHEQRYLAIYEIETDDLAALDAEIGRHSREGLWLVSDSLQANPGPTAVYFEQV